MYSNTKSSIKKYVEGLVITTYNKLLKLHYAAIQIKVKQYGDTWNDLQVINNKKHNKQQQGIDYT